MGSCWNSTSMSRAMSSAMTKEFFSRLSAMMDGFSLGFTFLLEKMEWNMLVILVFS